MFAIGESIPTLMADGGWSDPQVPLSVYAHAMRRDEGENERLRALIEGLEIPGLVTSDHWGAGQTENAFLVSRSQSRS